jgi:hypothetical protein
MTVQAPRHRRGTFEPASVPEYPRRIAGIDEAVVSLKQKATDLKVGGFLLVAVRSTLDVGALASDEGQNDEERDSEGDGSTAGPERKHRAGRAGEGKCA